MRKLFLVTGMMLLAMVVAAGGVRADDVEVCTPRLGIPVDSGACVMTMGEPNPSDPPMPRVDLGDPASGKITVGIHVEGRSWGVWVIVRF